MSWLLPEATVHIDEARRKDASDLAAIHAESFTHGWSAEEFASLLAQSNVICLCARRVGVLGAQRTVGFILARVAADEAEILTVAVLPASRGRRTGRRLVEETIRRLYRGRIRSLFLEVDENNRPAVSLYKSLGFQQVGERTGYYREPGGAASALVMRLQVR
jgi:ribosomal-protein-alanine N-acetyltransferase